MAIRFLCSACAQPIEVDDEWSLKPVICPYCRKTVTAPRESTVDLSQGVPSASPITLPPGAIGAPPLPYGPPAAPAWVRGAPAGAAAGNSIAIAAFVFACCSLGLYLTAAFLMGRHWGEIEPMVRASADALQTGDMGRMAQLREDFVSQPGGPPPWFIAFSVVLFGSGLAWVATLVCGLMGLRRAQRRKFAFAALAIAAILPVLVCCGVGVNP